MGCWSHWRRRVRVVFLLAIKGLTSRDRTRRCAKRVMKEGCGAIATFGKNKLRDPAFWRRQALILYHPINQINDWNPTALGKKVWENLVFYIFYSKLLELLTTPVACQHSCFSELCWYIDSLWASNFPAPLLANPPYCCSSKLCPIVLFIPWHWDYTSLLSSKAEPIQGHLYICWLP